MAEMYFLFFIVIFLTSEQLCSIHRVDPCSIFKFCVTVLAETFPADNTNPNIKKENTHFPSLEGLKTYDEEIKKAGGVDLQLLGIGADGHIGFNEPNTPFDSLTHIADLTEKTIQDNSRFFASIQDVPTQAVTRGRQSIRNAKKIILIATGKNKALAIEKTFGKVNEATPASLLNRHPDATIYCDEEAASLLKK